MNLKQAPPERYVLEGEEIGLLILIQPQNKTMQNQAKAFRDASSSAFFHHCHDISNYNVLPTETLAIELSTF